MKKKIAAFALAVCMMALFAVVASAAEGDGNSEPVWNLWDLLNPANLNLGRLLAILISTFATIGRVIGGAGGLQNMLSLLWDLIKNAIPHA